MFHWRGGYLTREVLLEIMKEAATAAEEKDKYIKMSFNHTQAVIQLQITDKLSETGEADIRQEEAGEGEE